MITLSRILLPLFFLFGYTCTAFGQEQQEQDGSTEKDSSAPDIFVSRKVPDTTVQRWKKDPDLAYANDPDYWHKKEEQKKRNRRDLSFLLGALLASRAFIYFIYIILGALLLYVIIHIMSENNVQLFYRSSRKRKGSIRQDTPSDEEGEDLGARLQQVIQTGDYRQATRYLYLITLTRLHEKGLIRWHREATNQEYLHQLKGSAWEGAFRNLTGYYEKVWYGEFPLGEAQFTRLHHYFEDFDKTVPA